jgi:DNA-binding transcriptional LysR family regulator
MVDASNVEVLYDSRMNLDLKGLVSTADRMMLVETFVRIVDAGSLSAAARLLETTQPTISRRLKALEKSLGVRLLQRSTHAMALTDDGMRCYTRAKELIAGWQEFESEIRGAGEEPVGLLRVIAPHAFGQQQLVGPLAEYLQRYPKMTVDWTLHDRTPDFIAEGIDCAIRVGDIPDPSVVAIRLGEVPRIVVCAPSVLAGAEVPTHPEQLAALPWIAVSTFYRTEVALTQRQTGEALRFSIAPRMYTDNLYAMRSAALLRGRGAWLIVGAARGAGGRPPGAADAGLGSGAAADPPDLPAGALLSGAAAALHRHHEGGGAAGLRHQSPDLTEPMPDADLWTVRGLP